MKNRTDHDRIPTFVSRWLSLGLYPVAGGMQLLIVWVPRLDRSWALRLPAAVNGPSHTGAGAWSW